MIALKQDELKVIEALIKAGRCSKEELEQFDEKELKILIRSTVEYLEKGESLTIKKIEASDYEYEIPSIKKFIENPYYMGKELGFPRDDSGKILHGSQRLLYDYWLDKLEKLYSKVYYQVLITGAIGIGKTTLMNTILLYDFLKLYALKNPQRHYNLTPSTRIIFAFFNVLKEQAHDVSYGQFQGMMDSSPFFQETMNRNKALPEGYQLQPRSEKKIGFRVGSRVRHTLGIAVFGAEIDEANFGQDKIDKRDENKKSQVYENYVGLLRRKESRFLQRIEEAGHFCIGSSKRIESDFLEKHIEKNKDTPGVFVVDASQYEAKQCRHGLYSGKMFSVVLGDISREPRLLKDDEKEPKDARVLHVPVEHKEAYETDIIGALRDISGVASQPTQAFFTNRDAVRAAVDKKRFQPWQYSGHSKISNTLNISFYGQDQIYDFMVKDLIFWKDGQLPYKNSPRFMAFDTGYAGDAAGCACVCKAGVKILEKDKRKIFIPKYYTDFYIRIKGKDKEQFPLYKLRELTKFLISMWQIPIKGIATDGFQSIQLQQDLKIAFPSLIVEQNSVDRTDSPYLQYRDIIYANLMEGMYEDENLLVELFDLIHIYSGRRGSVGNMQTMLVDHPTIASDGQVGRKDVADAHCNATVMCKNTDVGQSSEEAAQSIQDMKGISIDTILKDAEKKVDEAMKSVEALNIDELFR